MKIADEPGSVEQPKGFKGAVSNIIIDNLFLWPWLRFKQAFNLIVRRKKPCLRYQKRHGRYEETFLMYKKPFARMMDVLAEKLWRIEENLAGEVEPLRSSMLDFYTRLGPYLDKSLVAEIFHKFEHGSTQSGTDPTSAAKEFDYYSLNIRGTMHHIKIPQEYQVRFVDGSTHYMRTFGTQVFAKPADIEALYWPVIKTIIDAARNAARAGVPEGGQRRLDHLDWLAQYTEGHVLKELSNRLWQNEHELYEFFNKELYPCFGEIAGLMETLQAKYGIDVESASPANAIKWRRTYKIINPRASEEMLTGAELKTVQKANSSVPKEEYDVALGLDMNGWPLEVRPTGRSEIRNGRMADEYAVYIDEIEDRKDKRKFWAKRPEGDEVPLVIDLDPLQVITFKINDYDLYRDSIRDGRYNDSLTCFDYAIASHLERQNVQRGGYWGLKKSWKGLLGRANVALGGELAVDLSPELARRYTMRVRDSGPPISTVLSAEQKGEIKKIEEKRKARIAKLSGNDAKINDAKIRDINEAAEYEIKKVKMSAWKVPGKRGTAHLVPAFDRRFIEYWKRGYPVTLFGGKKFYYDTPGYVLKFAEEERARGGERAIYWGPRISSRGVSNYLWDRMYREEMFLDELDRAFRQFSQMRGVWDLGPREFADELKKSPLDLIPREATYLTTRGEVPDLTRRVMERTREKKE